jgi:hypothetical protein
MEFDYRRVLLMLGILGLLCLGAAIAFRVYLKHREIFPAEPEKKTLEIRITR